MKKETLTKLYPFLAVCAALLMIGAFLLIGIFLTPEAFLEGFLPWRLEDIWAVILFYSLLFLFIYLSLRARVWLEIVPVEVMQNNNPRLEWFAVITVFTILALLISRLTYALGVSEGLNSFLLWVLLFGVYWYLVKRLPLVSIFSSSNYSAQKYGK